MAKEKITREAYLQLVGVLTLAHHHVRQLDEIARAAAELVGESGDGGGYFGHVSDAISDERSSADSLLSKLGITVEAPADAAPAESSERE